jgi:hypothetical protein
MDIGKTPKLLKGNNKTIAPLYPYSLQFFYPLEELALCTEKKFSNRHDSDSSAQDIVKRD